MTDSGVEATLDCPSNLACKWRFMADYCPTQLAVLHQLPI